MATQCCGQQTYGSADQQRNEKRAQLIDDIKILIENIDNEERGRSKGPRGRAAGGGTVRDPDLERQCPCREYRKRRGCSPPIITSVASHEVRPTSDFTRKRHDNTSQVTYVDATREAGDARLDPVPPAPWVLPRTPSQELRAGTLYRTCECCRRNGLQHDCPRWECGGRPQCVAVNPGPCCAPASARKPVRGDRRHLPQGAEVEDRVGQQEKREKEEGEKREEAGGHHRPGLVVPVFVHVGGQAQQQGGPRGGQSPNAPTQGPARIYLCEPQGGQRSNPGAEKITEMPGPYEKQNAGQHQQNQSMRYTCQPQGQSARECAGKITAMPGPYGWPAGGPGQQGGQQPNQTARTLQGGPITLQGPGVACLCRPAGGQAPQQAPQQPQFGAGVQGPVTLQGPGVTCVCRPSRPQQPQPQVGGGGYVEFSLPMVTIGQPIPRQ